MSEHTMNQVEEIEKIDLIRIINNMWKGFRHYWLVLGILVLSITGASCFRTYQSYSPVYTANATFTITFDELALYNNTSYLNTRAATQIVNTFPYILSSGILQKKVAEDLGTETVPGSMTTETLGNTNMVTVIATSSEPEIAYAILESAIKHYPEVAEPVIGEVSMNLLDITGVPESPSNPLSFKNSIMKGALAGVALSLAILLMYAFTRRTIHEEGDFKKILNIDCICAIPQIIFKKRGKEFRKDISIYNQKISRTFLEAIRVLRARIEKEAVRNDLKVFLVTSAAPGEGKSTIAANIAMALGMRDSKVVLVDCDLRNPSVKERLNMPEEGVGLFEYLTKQVELKDILQWNEEYKMYVVPGGKAIGNGSELIDSPRMYELLDLLRDFADYIILDTAPVGILTDTAVLAQTADSALFVVKQDYANRSAIMDAIEQLSESRIHFSGCILNGAQAGIGGYGYKNYRYYGGYHSGNYYRENEKDGLQEK